MDGFSDFWADIVGGLHDLSESRLNYDGRVGMMAFENDGACVQGSPKWRD